MTRAWEKSLQPLYHHEEKQGEQDQILDERHAPPRIICRTHQSSRCPVCVLADRSPWLRLIPHFPCSFSFRSDKVRIDTHRLTCFALNAMSHADGSMTRSTPRVPRLRGPRCCHCWCVWPVVLSCLSLSLPCAPRLGRVCRHASPTQPPAKGKSHQLSFIRPRRSPFAPIRTHISPELFMSSSF